jgi:O-acetyl-ADP-ribose deacetylase (regulator of RNase III)
VDSDLNGRLSVCHSPLEELEVDAIVLPTDVALTHSSALAARVARAAGPAFTQECTQAGKMALGQAVRTHGHGLRAQVVLHTALPKFNPAFRAACATALSDSTAASLAAALVATPPVRTVAIPSIYPEDTGWPQAWACGVVLKTLRAWLAKRPEASLQVTLCADSAAEYSLLQAHLPVHFPRKGAPGGGGGGGLPAYSAAGTSVPAASVALLPAASAEASRLGGGDDDWRHGRFAYSREALGARAGDGLKELTADLAAAQMVRYVGDDRRGRPTLLVVVERAAAKLQSEVRDRLLLYLLASIEPIATASGEVRTQDLGTPRKEGAATRELRRPSSA